MTTELNREDHLVDRPDADVVRPTAEPGIPAPRAEGSRPLRRWSVGELIARALAARPATGPS
jgi:hypothetical protein